MKANTKKNYNSYIELESKKANFCTMHCPHPNDPCRRAYCDEFQKKFRIGKYSMRKSRRKV